MHGRWIWLAVGLAAGCSRPPPVGVEPVRLHVAPGLPGALVAELAAGFEIAKPVLVDTAEEAEVAWLADPVAALALGERAVPGSAPEQPRIPEEYVDPRRRFAPVGGIARVIVTRDGEGFQPDELRDLADPRVRGRVALTPLGRGGGPMLVAALELAYGERGTRGWLRQLAANAPILLDDDAAVAARVASGGADYGLVGSLAGGAEPGLRLVFPDQGAKGCLVTPTALVILPGAGPAARKFGAWLAGPIAEEVLAQRIVGLLPLREKALAHARVVPAWRLEALTVDWSRMAERTPLWAERLRGWPADFAPSR